MNVEEKKSCNLCLNATGEEFRIIDETTRDIFDVLLLNKDLGLSKNAILCHNCTGLTRRFFYFKLRCIETEKTILSFAVDNPETEIDFKEIATNVNQEDICLCRFCMSRLEKTPFVSVDCLMRHTIFMEMLPLFMPEMDFSTTRNPVICVVCREELESYLKFIQNYLSARINSSDNNIQTVMIKQEANTIRFAKSVRSKVYDQVIKIKKIVDVKDEKVASKGVSDVIHLDPGSYKFLPELESYKCMQCTYVTKNKRLLKMHVTNHKDVSEIAVYKCDTCSFKTRYKTSLKRHVLIHKNVSEVKMHKCPTCIYQTKLKCNLKAHMLVHKDTSEVEMYKCMSCKYTTKYKNYLKTHMLVHMEPLTVKTYYKCIVCAYEADCKKDLTSHMAIHTSSVERRTFGYASNTENYRCATCNYETKYKNHLAIHMKRHKQVNLYTCVSCTFTSKYKSSLKKHMWTHKDPSELEMHQCAACSYRTKNTGNLRRHLLTHKDPAEIRTYDCTECSYEAKERNLLTRHMKRIHMK